MIRTVLVTGATGTVGRHAVDSLVDRDAHIRVGVRDPGSATDRFPECVEVVAFDFEKPETWGETLSGVDGLFLVRPPTVDAGTVAAFAEAADRVGVGRVAYLSTLGAEKNPLVPHHRIEKRVVATGASHTLLRASFFMQNLLEVHRADLVDNGEVFVPAGDGETSFVDARDLGEIVAVVLTERGHGNRAYDLTGPEALDYHEVAAVFSDVLDRRITYPRPSPLSFAARTYRRGAPPGFVLLMCGIYTTVRLGLAGRVTGDCRRILGRPPRDLRAFVEDYADEFRADAETVHLG
ncbi:NAD(P)-dependent oxidoreductase [Halobacteriales archaeon QS_8_69_26]|nr:MAG: NAD(P)-dependent oxidoreductase [Halobacteriales archaeon QS_8_69_26]